MSETPPSTVIIDRLREAFEPIASAHGCDLEEVEIKQAGNRSRVSVSIDRDGGVDLDTVADFSREISEILDRADFVKLLDSAYTLDVGSRGTHRPLVEPRHWRRAMTRLIKIELKNGESVSGRLVEADETSIKLVQERDPRYHSTKPPKEVKLKLADVKRALVEVDFRALPDVDIDDDEIDDQDLTEGDDE